MPPIGAAAEVACYRIAAEALSNARRHSGADHVVLEVHAEDHALRIRVGDDGHGLPARTRAGAVGLESMRVRAEELGGRFEVGSSPSGTTVVALLPLEES
jgi:two-component system NarL family sensor kinase